MEWLFVAIGAALILVGWYDVFHTLLHPSGRGRMSRCVISLLWAFSKKLPSWASVAVGPTAIVMVVVIWAAIQILGWAFVYLAWMPGGFSFSPGLRTYRYVPFLEALAFSAVSLSTVGYGDVVPSEPVLRLLAPAESLIGFALLSAAVAWLLQIYPTLARQRTLALRLSLLHEANFAEKLQAADPATASLILESLASDVSQARVDYLQNSETYYFEHRDPRTSLAQSLTFASDLAERARQSPEPGTRLAAATLQASLDDLAAFLRKNFVHAGDTTDEVFSRYARDHGRQNRRQR